MELSGQIHPSIHQWQYFGADFLIQLLILNGTLRIIGGIDGQLLGQLFPYFHLTDQLILDKVFREASQTVIGFL